MIFGAIFGLVAAFGLVVAIILWCKITGNPQNQGSDIHPPNYQTEREPLQMQEIVLIHFPDTEKFRELNNKFRDWLASLSSVREVIDVNDDKYSEG